jgi:hypothetical protein
MLLLLNQQQQKASLKVHIITYVHLFWSYQTASVVASTPAEHVAHVQVQAYHMLQ